jgi:F0F1-type ATP synthase gamma subunit
MDEFQEVAAIYQQSTSLNQLNLQFRVLEQLNQLLAKALPANLTKHCHVGALDIEKSMVVIFVASSEAFHILRNMSNHILQTFNQANFDFDKVLIKVSQYKTSAHISIKARKLNPAQKEKLQRLANSIGKPELISTSSELAGTKPDEELKL